MDRSNGARFFAYLEPAFYVSVASHFTVKQFVAVNEAFTSDLRFKVVWHNRTKKLMRDVWPVIDSKAALRWILKSGIKCTDWCLMFPGCMNSAESYETLLKEGEISLIKFINDVAIDIPLLAAVLKGKIDFIEDLVDQGANVDAKTLKRGITSLHWAAHHGKLDVVKCLVELGADTETEEDDGRTPLHLAAYSGHLDVVKCLVELGADKDVTTDDGSTPLHIAAYSGHLDVVKYLVDFGADKDVRTDYGKTPLHIAALNGHLDVVKYLVKHGADKEARDDDGRTPLHLAVIDGHLDVVECLVKYGADKETRDDDEWTAVYIAVDEGHHDIAEYLVGEITSRDE